VLPAAAGSQGAGCTIQTVEVGIVKAKSCFTSTPGMNGATIYTATGPATDQVDLNGFIIRLRAGDSLTINNKTNEVSSGGRKLQLLSINWPIKGQPAPLGDPMVISFVAPGAGSLLLEDVRLGTNNAFVGALAGLSPVGTIDTPVTLLDGGKGSMDVTVALSGIFTLKGKDQTVNIKLPTEVGKGTTLDGFDLKLKEIDGLRAIKIENLDAEYSAANGTLAGNATAVFPFTVAGDLGFGVGFRFENGTIDEFDAKVTGLRIPIGAPPGGFITEVGGGFRRAVISKCGQELNITAAIKAIFGPEVPTPFGKVPPIGANAALQLGSDNQCALFFKLTGGVEVFRLPVGDVLLEMHTNGLINFGAGLGVGFPSYRNNPDDPFYIGARVGGWVAKQKFQFEGSGKVRLIGLDIFEGRILVNDRAAGACWKVLFADGGAVYAYGSSKVETFGIGCGLDAYKEQFPGGAALAAGRSRKIRLDSGQVVLEARGAGGPPRFTATSSDGRVYSSPGPTGPQSVKANDHLFFVNNTGTNKTNLFIRRPKGVWTITPHPGSPAIVSLRAGRQQAPERVQASVTGSGLVRTLRWRSLDRPHTRLIFSESMRGGLQIPILDTDGANGTYRFRVAQGSNYGTRRLRVTVKHGYASRQAMVVNRYTVLAPARLRAPKRVSARRYDHDVFVTWSGVTGARGYLVEVSKPGRGGGRQLGLVRRVASRSRSAVFRDTPGGGRLIVRVLALNSDDRIGGAGAALFPAGPSVRTLPGAVRSSARSYDRRAGTVNVVTTCPANEGHCQVLVELRSNGRLVGRSRFQQTPDTFHLHRIRPNNRRLVQLIRQGRNPGIEVVVKMRHGVSGALSVGRAT
jgi:hypothetical protein